MTWILASDWSRLTTCPGYWPLISQGLPSLDADAFVGIKSLGDISSPLVRFCVTGTENMTIDGAELSTVICLPYKLNTNDDQFHTNISLQDF